MPSSLINSCMIAGTRGGEGGISVTYGSSAMKVVFLSPFSCRSDDRYHIGRSYTVRRPVPTPFFFSPLYLPPLFFLAPLGRFPLSCLIEWHLRHGEFSFGGRAQHNVVSLRLAFSLALYLSVRSSLVRNCYL